MGARVEEGALLADREKDRAPDLDGTDWLPDLARGRRNVPTYVSGVVYRINE